MPAPLAKGLIITASILIAAGIAIYESPQVRQWVDQSRRKIAIALHNLGDEIQPRFLKEEEREARRKKREEILRKRRADLIRKAQEEGVAVDLDELARISEEAEAEEKKILQEEEDRALAEQLQAEFDHESPNGTDNSPASHNINLVGQKTFDGLVGSNGMLRSKFTTTEAIGKDTTTSDGLRHRGRGIEGLHSGSAFATPFADEDAQMIFDRELIGAEKDEIPPALPPKIPVTTIESTPINVHKSTTFEGNTTQGTSSVFDMGGSHDLPQMVQIYPSSDHALWQSSSSSTKNSSHFNPFDDTNNVTESQSGSAFFSLQNSNSDLYAAASPPQPEPLHLAPLIIPLASTIVAANVNTEDDVMSAGTLTPTSEHEFETDASHVDSQADDIAILSENDHDHDDTDARSEVFSEAGFSVISAGAATPSSWTDVGSDTDGEMVI